MNHTQLIADIDSHYDFVRRGLTSTGSMGDPVKEVIGKIVRDRDAKSKQENQEFWANKAANERDPKLRREYLSRYFNER